MLKGTRHRGFTFLLDPDKCNDVKGMQQRYQIYVFRILILG